MFYSSIKSIDSIVTEMLPHLKYEGGTPNSKFIESGILKIPLTIIVNNHEVIRGADIICSYVSFMNDELTLEGFVAPYLKGKKASELKRWDLRTLKISPIMFTCVEITPELAKIIFEL